MKFLKVFPLFVLSALALIATSCDREDDDHHMHGMSGDITINILEPSATVGTGDCASVNLKAEIIAEDENHEIEVELYPVGDEDNEIFKFEEHNHDAEIIFEQSVDLCSFNSGDCFILKVEACKDHDCESYEEVEFQFCLE